MPRSNLHTHSVYSDGSNTMEEIVQAALERDFVSLGFSDHAPSPYETGVAVSLEKLGELEAEFNMLKAKYAGQLELYRGIELDALSDFDPAGLDYFIGSVHFITDHDGTPHCVDYKIEMMEEAIRCMGGAEPFVKRYFDTAAAMAEERKPDILGHMDIFTKTNDDNRYFDEDAPWYRAVCKKAAERIAATGVIVEVNTALAQRKGRSRPYPSPWLLECLRAAGAEVTISSDSHRIETLSFWFEEAEALLRQCGFRAVKQLRGGVFVDVAL